MKFRLTVGQISVLLVIVILLVDQISKFWVKTNMTLGQEFSVFGNWFLIHFTENNGMAFGLEISGEYGKMILSIFRLLAIGGIIWYIFHLIKLSAPKGLVISVSLILAGAMGNIIDSAFYGLIFNESYFTPAVLFPEEGGYASFLHGRVVDMFYFPIVNGFYPDWVPWLGSKQFIFFRPVFNIADTAITTGVLITLIFYRSWFNKKPEENETETIPG